MYGPAVRCKKISRVGGKRSCINVSGFCLERWLLAIMDISARAISLSDRPRPGQLGHQCSQTPGRPNLHLIFILSQTSAGSSQFFMHTKRLTPWPALPRSFGHWLERSTQCGPVCWRALSQGHCGSKHRGHRRAHPTATHVAKFFEVWRLPGPCPSLLLGRT